MLIADQLSIRRGNQIILRDLSISIAPGKIVALLGRNGAGKSTLLKALSGEFHATPRYGGVQLSGYITINNIALDSLLPQTLALTRAVLPQSVQFAFPFKGKEIVMLGRYPHGGGDSITNRKIVSDVMSLAGAATLAERDVTTLSGGELARVQFARVLAQLRPAPLSTSTEKLPTTPPKIPRYLLLDEPTAALDLAHQHTMLTTLRWLAKEWNIGILAIMHDPNLAARYADQIAWLADGAMLVQDTPTITMTPETVDACFGIQVEVIKQTGKPPFAMPINTYNKIIDPNW